MPQHPNPYIVPSDVIQEMIGKALKIAAPKSAPIKMKTPGILSNSADSDLKFRKEVLAELNRNLGVPLQDFVQIRLDPPVEPNFHGGESLQRARRR